MSVSDPLEEPVDFKRLERIVVIHHSEGVEGNLVLPEQCQPRHYGIKSRSPVSLDPVSVVEFPRAINTQPNKKAVLFEKAAPVIREQGAVGLNGVGDLFAPGIFFLQRHHRPEIVDTQQSGLAALPGKLHFRCVLALDVLSDEAFKYLRGHPK